MTAPSQPDLKELLARVEKATGPDTALNADLWWMLDHAAALTCFNNGALGLPRALPATLPIPAGLGRAGVEAMAPKFTASIDAALALVERVLPGWSWVVFGPDSARLGLAGAILGSQDPSEPAVEVYAPTPTLAVICALLKALLAKENDRG